MRRLRFETPTDSRRRTRGLRVDESVEPETSESWSGSTDSDQDEQAVPDWEYLRDRAREFFGAATWDRMRERERAREQEHARAEQGGNDEHEQLRRLRAETRLGADRYMQSLRDSNIYVPGMTEEERQERLSATHQVYVQMMIRSAMRPLSGGVTPSAVVQTMGTMTTMMLLSKNFRDEVGRMAEPIREKIDEHLDQRVRHHVDKRTQHAEQSLQRRQQFFGNLPEGRARDRLVGREAVRDDLTPRMRRRFEDIQRRQRGNRDMFTPTSAALTQVGLMENAFWLSREEGVDGERVRASHEAMMKRLRQQFVDDGLDSAEVSRHARIIIGQRLEAEPELATVFEGMAHGRMRRSADHREQVPGTDRVRSVWTGEFEDQVGRPLPENGMFRMRGYMGHEEHQAHMGWTMEGAIEAAVVTGDDRALSATMQGYLIGHAARRQGLDVRGLPAQLRCRLEESEVMLASMEIDGHDEQAQSLVYSNAYFDAMKNVAGRYPEFEQTLERSLGSDWRQRLEVAAEDPWAFVAEQRYRASQGQADPTDDYGQEQDFDMSDRQPT